MSVKVIRVCIVCGEQIKAEADTFDEAMEAARERARKHRREEHGETNALW
jgi:predicted nucleic acid-binding Zn ribbon protein